MLGEFPGECKVKDMDLNNFDKKVASTPKDVIEYVACSMDILDRLNELLQVKFNGDKRLLAKAMGKPEAEVTELLCGVQNFTLKTLMKFQVAFGEPVIIIPRPAS